MQIDCAACVLGHIGRERAMPKGCSGRAGFGLMNRAPRVHHAADARQVARGGLEPCGLFGAEHADMVDGLVLGNVASRKRWSMWVSNSA